MVQNEGFSFLEGLFEIQIHKQLKRMLILMGQYKTYADFQAYPKNVHTCCIVPFELVFFLV